MPERETLQRAREDAREGKSPSTQAGEFVREEIHHVREGKHGVRNAKQAIAIGLSKARKAGVKLPPNPSEKNPRRTAGKSSSGKSKPSKSRSSKTRSQATSRALKREGHSGTSRRALAKHAHSAAGNRTKSNRSRAASRAARTREREGRSVQ
ncbi:MAG: DUF6496 domain-containing protein [Terriglobales bacterium]